MKEIRKMKTAKTVAILVLGATLATSLYAETPTAKEQGMQAIKALGSTLKGQLKAKMKEDPSGVAAVTFCADKAEALTKEVNAKLPDTVRVRRTSLKIRSSANKPDSTDSKVMENFAKELAAKKISPSTIKVVEVEGATRVYKPLVAQKVCLKCHGTNIDPKIKTIIDKHYPEDQATGFKMGDLRGVIVAEVKKQ
jgi:hypothetical protein